MCIMKTWFLSITKINFYILVIVTFHAEFMLFRYKLHVYFILFKNTGMSHDIVSRTEVHVCFMMIYVYISS